MYGRVWSFMCLCVCTSDQVWWRGVHKILYVSSLVYLLLSCHM